MKSVLVINELQDYRTSNPSHLDLLSSPEFHFLQSFSQKVKFIVESDGLVFVSFLITMKNANYANPDNQLFSQCQTLLDGFLSMSFILFSSLFLLSSCTVSFSLLRAAQT